MTAPRRPPSADVAPAEAADLRQILDQVPSVIGLLDRAHRHRFINDSGARMTGLPADEIVGRTNADIGWVDDDAANRPLAERAMEGEIVSVEGWNRSKSGRLRFVQRDYYPNRGPDGFIDGYWGVARDATDLKVVEARSAAMVASALDCIVAMDANGLIMEFNPAAERTFGYSRAQAIGRPMVDLLVPRGFRAAHLAGLHRFLETDEPRLIGRRVEIGAMRSDGSEFPCELSIAEIRVADQRIFMAYLRDLTAAREAEAEILRQRDALLQSEKMATYGLLLAGVAHELNNPLSIVLGHALMLREGAAGTAHGERAAKIEEAAERCARIVRSFLAMAREQPLEPHPVDLATVAREALDGLHDDLKGVAVFTDLRAGLPQVMGDADQLRQVIVNLVGNARQALAGTTGPRIDIAVRAVGGDLELTVSDNGPGVPRELRRSLFDPFVTSKPVGSGSGIGLTVSRGLVEAHGGTLALAESDALAGACFIVRLPSRAADVA